MEIRSSIVSVGSRNTSTPNFPLAKVILVRVMVAKQNPAGATCHRSHDAWQGLNWPTSTGA